MRRRGVPGRLNGVNYCRARYYHPGFQRFASEDPIGLPGGPNGYLYVDNSPVAIGDPTGLLPGSGTLKCASAGLAAPFTFLQNCVSMRRAWTKRADKYFHCLANCQASQGGPCGQTVGTWISDAREWVDQTVKRDSPEDSERDQAANRFGRCEASRYPQTPCDQLCGPYRPPGLPPRYGGQMPVTGP